MSLPWWGDSFYIGGEAGSRRLSATTRAGLRLAVLTRSILSYRYLPAPFTPVSASRSSARFRTLLQIGGGPNSLVATSYVALSGPARPRVVLEKRISCWPYAMCYVKARSASGILSEERSSHLMETAFLISLIFLAC